MQQVLVRRLFGRSCVVCAANADTGQSRWSAGYDSTCSNVPDLTGSVTVGLFAENVDAESVRTRGVFESVRLARIQSLDVCQ